MRRNDWWILVGVFAMAGLVATSTAKDKKSAQQEEKKSQVAKKHDGVHDHDHGTKSEKEGDGGGMMQFMAMGSPSAGHALLEPFVGHWNVVTRMRMVPEAPWMESRGQSDISWTLGKRFLEERVTAEAMGMPFKGIGYTGYDNYRKEYVGLWMDSMTTAPMISKGSVDDSGKKFTYVSTMDDVVLNRKDIEVRVELIVVGENTFRMDMFSPDASGKVFKSMTIEYTRRKADEG